MSEKLTPEQWCDLADALGEVRKSDGAPRVLDGERLIECVREMRAERDELRSDLEAERAAHEKTRSEAAERVAHGYCSKLRAEIASTRDLYHALTLDFEKLCDAREVEARDLAAANVELTALTTELDHQRVELVAVEAERDTARAELAELQGLHGELIVETVQLRETVRQLQEQNNNLATVIALSGERGIA